MLAAEASRERSRTINKRLQDCDEDSIEQLFAALLDHAKQELGATAKTITTSRSVDVRYRGQSHALNLPWSSLQGIAQAFHEKHEDSYGHRLAMDIELVNVRVRAIEQRQSLVLPAWQSTAAPAIKFTTMPGFSEPVPVIDRAGLTAGRQLTGPVLITETSSTTWLAPGWSTEVDNVGNLLFTAL
jgi:N-methylhydantoinase A